MDFFCNVSYIGCHIALKYPGTCNHEVCTCTHNSLQCIIIDATIYLDINIQLFLINKFTKLLDLLRAFVHVFLSAKSWLNSHYQHHIHIFKKMADVIYRCGWLD